MSETIKYVTVLMAVYNDSKFLVNSVRSILNQTHKDFEFLIIDDGSKDNPEEVISSFKDSRIIFKKINHCGLACALNFGLSISTYDWIARIDADDINTVNRLRTQIEFLNANTQYDVVSSRSVYFKDPDKILFSIKLPEEDEGIKLLLNLHNPVNHSSVIYNKKKILNAGGYNKDFHSYEDYELWFRMKNELKFKIIPEVLVYTRMRENSLTKTGNKKMIHDLLLKNAIEKIRTSGSAKEKKYWKNISFWTEYFYGDKDEARKYLGNDITPKKSIALLNTFLPDKIFKEILEFRLRLRLQSKFETKKRYQKELTNLLK